MIKVGLIGAETPDAGEILRILINHPEVDLVSLYAPSLSGHKIASVHSGFIGEQALTFTDKIDPAVLDAIFIFDDSDICKKIIAHIGNWDTLRLINLSPSRGEDWGVADFVYGLSEINRKVLVRGARMAVIPNAIAAVSLIALYPLASHLLLSSDILIDANLPADDVRGVDKPLIEEEIDRQLKNVQNSFNGNVRVACHPFDSARALKIKLEIETPLSLDEISRIYDSVYDDHNFTYIIMDSVKEAEVEGTQKCVISLNKTDKGTLSIEAVADCRLRGGAGDAVHVLNLFFALHEKIGLSLKPSIYEKSLGEPRQSQYSWFA